MTRIREAIPERTEEARKGDAGDILVVGGSATYPNTPAIVGMAAARTGADLARIAAPERSATACAAHAMDLIPRPLSGPRFGEEHVATVASMAANADVMVLGNGLGRHDDSLEAGTELLRQTDCPVVIDADMLHADLSRELFADRTAVLTPHRGEFAALYGEEADGDPGALKATVKHASRTLGAAVLLKGPYDVVSDGQRTEWTGAGVPAMARGGTGDLLAGCLATLLTRTDPVTAGHVAAALNGRAGAAAAEGLGESMLLEDILDRYPEAIRGLIDVETI